MAKNDKLIYLPLGGSGEIGMNMYVYGYGSRQAERFILVDMGVTFPDMESTPGVDLIMADTAWIEARADRLEAIFITHAHEDHVGALGLLFSRFQVPVYARKFTAEIARLKMEERGQDPGIVNVVGAYPEQVTAGPFKVGFMPVAHSVPEASGLVIDTPAGRVVHTGDLKLDPDPVVGDAYRPEVFKEIAKTGIQALVCDSTNVFSAEPGRSEASLSGNITKLISQAEGLMVATTFASNIARLKTLAQAGVDAGRSVVVLGRSMQRMLSVGHATGVLTDFPKTLDVDEVQDIPRGHLMLIVTGSQGERRAASGQLAAGKYMGFVLKEGDTFLFSSKTIPGNEVGVARIMNAMSAMGVTIIDDSSGLYHVSGHANRPDLQKLHQMFSPKMVVPMHGEHRHLREHMLLAESTGIAAQIAPNGTMLDLSGDKPHVLEHVETGRTYLDGSRLIGAYDGVVLNRIRLATRGSVVVSLIFDEAELLGGSWAEVAGMPDTAGAEPHLVDQIERRVDQELKSAKRKVLLSDDAVEQAVSRAIRGVCKDKVGKKPEITVMINRLAPA